MHWLLCWLSLLSGSAVLSSGFSHSARLFGTTQRHVSTFLHSSLLEETPPKPNDSLEDNDDGVIVLADDEDFIKPLPDKRKYRSVQYSNGLEVLLVSAPDHQDVEAGAVHVKAGHFHDTRPGLAHFLEHTLFLGTQKYPNPNDYDGFLNTHGGSSNAYTDMEDTNYYFSVTSSGESDAAASEETNDNQEVSTALRGALDRFAQFFIAPLFSQDMVDRELRAVDSEYRNSLSQDAWRHYMLMKNASNPLHPFAKFGCGNFETLTNGGVIVNSTASVLGGTSSSPRQDLIDFWQTYYQPYNLRLCVVGRASLDALQQVVQETFGKVPPNSEDTTLLSRRKTLENPPTLFASEHAQYSTPTTVIKAFDETKLGKIRTTVPLLTSHLLKLSFAAPPLDDALLKESRPYRVLSHLLGHESPGSLYVLLNQQGYVNGLTSGIGIDTCDFSMFSLTLSLTKKGMEEYESVLDLVFQWIALVRHLDDDTMHQYHDELRQISNTNFEYRENGDPTDFCSSAAELLFDYEPSQLLCGSSRTGDYDPVIGRAFMDRMRPENCLITVINSDLDATKGEWETEPWYGAKFRDTKLSQEQLERWSNPPDIDSRLHLPALNEYIPTDFSLKCDQVVVQQQEDDDDDLEALELEPPSLILKRPNLRMWFKMDRNWRVPKTYIRLALVSPNVYRSPRTMTLNRIYQRILNDDLNSFVYDASMAGCNYRVNCIPQGYRISVNGYSEKLPILLDTLTARTKSLAEEMKRGEPSLEPLFVKAKDSLLRETKNYRLDSPYEVASYNARLLMEENVWYVNNYIDEMEGPEAKKNPLTLQECARVAEECLYGRVKAEAICIGNVNEDDANKVVDVIDHNFLKDSRPLLDVETPIFRSLKLPTRAEALQIFGPEVADKSIPLVYQELAFSESEENNAVEVVLQADCEFELGYEGIAILDLIAHIAYTSAYNRLRTELQLGYIVSAFSRRTSGGSWGLSIVVQSSTAEPDALEEQIEAWLVQFREEIEKMSPEELASEAAAVVAQLLERDTKLSQEVSRVWHEIVMTESLSDQLKHPQFDRVDRIAEQLLVSDKSLDETHGVNGEKRHSAAELKQKMLNLFDKYFAADSPDRRALSSRVYSQNAKKTFEERVGKPGVLSETADIAHIKQYLSSWPTAPYWAVEQKDR